MSGIEVSGTQILGRWGRVTVLRYCQDAPLAASGSIAARTRRPAASVLVVNHEELKALREEVKHLEGRLKLQDESTRNELFTAIHGLKEELGGDGSDTVKTQAPPNMSMKMANLDFDWHGKDGGTGLRGVFTSRRSSIQTSSRSFGEQDADGGLTDARRSSGEWSAQRMTTAPLASATSAWVSEAWSWRSAKWECIGTFCLFCRGSCETCFWPGDLTVV